MKATIDVPDGLYRRVKSKAALEGRTIREVTTELYHRWLTEQDVSSESLSDEQWLDDWLRLGAETLRGPQTEPTATEILSADRNRFDQD